AKVIYGAQADPTRDFTQRALDSCQCSSGIDVYAYHTYPGYGRNLHPETMDAGAYGKDSPKALRQFVKNYSGIRPDISFFDDEFNAIPSWQGSDESVQAKYVPLGLLYNLAAGVKIFPFLRTVFVLCRERQSWHIGSQATVLRATFFLRSTRSLHSKKRASSTPC